MRVPIIAGNWKMNKTVAEAVELVRALREATATVEKVEMVVCPPFVSLTAVKDALAGSKIGLGAQNMYSERRQYFGETDATVNKRVNAALKVGLTPIVCVGETLAQREAGETASVVSNQVLNGLAGLTAEQAKSIVVAYEPVWAIGTGRASSGADATAVIAQNIRVPLTTLFGEVVAQGIRIQYGGSVTAANAAEFMGSPEIDGALVGGASLKVPDFLGIINATALVK
jgi:triosephosphate isomerase